MIVDSYFGNLLENGPHDLNGPDDDNSSFGSQNRLPDTLGASYDANGNLTWFGLNQYVYDPLNRMTHFGLTKDGVVEQDVDYWYDVDGERIGKCDRNKGKFTLFLRDESGNVMSEFQTTQCPDPQSSVLLTPSSFDWQEDYYYFGGRLAASENMDPGYSSGSECEPNLSASDIYFYHSDHLGSPRVITRLNNPTPEEAYGLVKFFHVYWPYGEEITNQTQDDLTHRYTGHERDFESNLDYMHARYYSPFQGRFLSPDPIRMKDKYIPQRWNLYQYAENNPIRFVDLKGEQTTPSQRNDFYIDVGQPIVHSANQYGINQDRALWVVAQAALETGYGNHLPNNNPFGLQGGSAQLATTEYNAQGQMVNTTGNFQTFSNIDEAANTYFDQLIQNFPDAFNALSNQDPTCFEEFTNGLQNGVQGVYATDPNYSTSLQSVFNRVLSEYEDAVQDPQDQDTGEATQVQPSNTTENSGNTAEESS